MQAEGREQSGALSGSGDGLAAWLRGYRDGLVVRISGEPRRLDPAGRPGRERGMDEAVAEVAAAAGLRHDRLRTLPLHHSTRRISERPVIASQMASTLGMISSFSRFMSSSVFETGTSWKGGQRSGIVSPTSR